MREILFRGKRLGDGEWVEGCFAEKKDPLLEPDVRNAFILAQACGDSFVTWFPVDPATVGQFTGLLDKNGKRIFEGDIVTLQYDKVFEMTGQVVFEDATFQLVDPDGTHECLWYEPHEMEVIGNIHDNPELLEVTPDE